MKVKSRISGSKEVKVKSGGQEKTDHAKREDYKIMREKGKGI